MQQRRRAKGGGGRDGGRPQRGGGKQWWWQAVDASTVDPLTLEPICEFQVEPFRIGKTLFDAEVLAQYLISTAMFAHPTTREKITREDCVNLDDHLRKLYSGRKDGFANTTSSVTEAFDLFHHSAAVNSRRKEQTEAMRREATVLFQHLFTFRSRRPPQSRRANRSAGLVVIDDDDETFGAHLDQAQFDFERDFPELFPVASHQLTSSSATFADQRHGANSANRLVIPAPRGGSMALGRIASSLLESEQEEEEEVPLFEPSATPETPKEANETHHEVILDEQGNENADAREPHDQTTVAGVDRHVEEMEEERRRLEFEAELRKQRQHEQRQRQAAMTSNLPINRRRPPPPKSKHNTIAPAAESPIVSEKKSSLNSPTSPPTVSSEPVAKGSRRRFMNPTTFKGPCAWSLLGTLLFVLIVTAIVLYVFPLPESIVE